MQPDQNNEQVSAPQQKSILHQVTPLSKYLAMVLFIILPFVGAYIGYISAPEKVVMIENEMTQTGNPNNIITTTKETDYISENALTAYVADSRYKTDGVDVYLFDDLEPRDEDDTIRQYQLKGADPATFEPFIVRSFPISQGNTFQAWISRDKNYVYYQDRIVEGADPASFVIDEEVPITRDENDVFLYYKKIPVADSKTYEVVFNTGGGGRGKVFGKDANNCYVEYEVLDCEEMPLTFEEAISFSR
jgi:hypothetical protein